MSGHDPWALSSRHCLSRGRRMPEWRQGGNSSSCPLFCTLHQHWQLDSECEMGRESTAAAVLVCSKGKLWGEVSEWVNLLTFNFQSWTLDFKLQIYIQFNGGFHINIYSSRLLLEQASSVMHLDTKVSFIHRLVVLLSSCSPSCKKN